MQTTVRMVEVYTLFLAAIARTTCCLLPSLYILQQESKAPFPTALYSQTRELVMLSFSLAWELAMASAPGRRSIRGAL
eukprot:COSAG02_NODE_54_length_43941_cov_54.857990_40_plen_78_part_00